MKKRLVLVLGGGLACALLSALLPLALAPYLPRPKPTSIPGARLPQSPAEYPDPNITWIYRWPGLTEESSIRGIGVYDSWHVKRLRAGWPLPMLEGGDYGEIHSSRGEAASGKLYPVHLKTWWSRDFKRRWDLPTALVWGGAGMVANWAIWSAAIGVWSLPGLVKRALRQRRGACLRCGYPRADGTSVCPECGSAAA